MADLHIYDKLLQFPLFLGMSSSDMMQMAAHTRFEFLKLPQGKHIVRAGEVCRHLHLLTDGQIKAETKSQDGAWRLIEDIPAPFIIQPERIVGISQRFTTTFTTTTESHFISISKREMNNLADSILVFRLNLIGLFATRAQLLNDATRLAPPSSLRGHIVRFLRSRCIYPSGRKVFHILMQRLALEVNDSRLDVSHALNEMHNEGLIQLTRGIITIPDISTLR